MQGFSVPLSPEGRAGLTPAPPWFFVGNILAVNYRADPDAVAAVLPPGLEPDPQDPGGCVICFADWQYTSSRDEVADPVRSQYSECLLLVNGCYEGQPVHTCPYIYVSRDVSMGRGWIQGWPKKLGSIHTTRTFPLASPAASPVAPGGRFAASLAVNDRRLAEASVTLQDIASDPVIFSSRPVLNVRYFPRLTAGQHDRPAVHELVRSRTTDFTRTEVWAGDATLAIFDAPDEEVAALAPVHVRRGYRYACAFEVSDLDILQDLTAGRA